MAAPNVGLFIPTTNTWNVDQLYDIDVDSPQFKELLIQMYQNIGLIAQVVNHKDSAYYTTQEFVNGQSFFPNPALNSNSGTTPTYRQVYRLLINFGALPNTGAKAVAHNLTLTAGYSFTRIYGTASDPVNNFYLPLPFASPTLANNIELSVTGTNVIVTTGSNRTNFTTTYIILEYLKF